MLLQNERSLCKSAINRTREGNIRHALFVRTQASNDDRIPDHRVTTETKRRAILLGVSSTLPFLLLPANAARADILDLVRNVVRPKNEYTPVQAVVVLMDARSTLREVKALASTPADSQERFVGRSQWPGFATRLRPAGPATPIVAALSSGGDRELTIGEMYGGKAGEPGVVDKVYMSLGKVLTISGRTIRREAQESPEAAAEAEEAIDSFLKTVPQEILDEAQAFRVQRAKDLGSSYNDPLSRLK